MDTDNIDNGVALSLNKVELPLQERELNNVAIKALFGLTRGQKWPKEGMHSRPVLGVPCWVVPLVGLEHKANYEGPRAMCLCPTCKELVTLTRLRRHHKALHVPKA